MIRRHFVRILGAVTALAIPSIAFATDYEVDPTHSNVGFTVRHLVSKVNGEFKTYSGDFSFDEKSPEKSKVTFTIEAKSISTGNGKRDNHLRSEDFFNVEKFPNLKFVSKKFAAAGKDKFKLTGDLTMRGVTKNVTFDVEFLGKAPGFQGETRVGFTATTTVNRKDYGISWNKTLDAGGVVVGEDVLITIQIEAGSKMPAKS